MRRSVLGGPALALALAVTLSGCGDDQPEADTPPSTSTSAAPQESTSPTGATGPTDAPTTAPTETGAPATGDTYADASPATGQPAVDGAGSVNVPADWPQDPSDEGDRVQAGPTSEYAVDIVESPLVDSDLDAIVETNLAPNVTRFEEVERLDDVVLLGQPAFHLAGPDKNFPSYVDQFGLVVGEREYTIAVSTPQDLPQGERDTLVASVMASFQVTG